MEVKLKEKFMNVIAGEVKSTAVEAGYQEERIPVLDAHFQRIMRENKIQAASYCMSRNGSVFADNALGQISIDDADERLYRPDTVFQIASITKMFTAVAVLKLIEDGMFMLDEPVGHFIEQLDTPPYDKITILHLLTHTSGLRPDMGTYEDKYRRHFWENLRGESPQDGRWIQAVLEEGLKYEPGTEWAYCSAGFMILGEVISRVSGMFCHDYIQKFIIEPCEMEDTHFGFRKEYMDRYNIPEKGDLEDHKKIQAGEEDGESFKEDWAAVPQTGGGLRSTCRDLQKFGQMILNNGVYNGKRIIGRKALEQMSISHTKPGTMNHCWGAVDPHRYYGLGPELVHPSRDKQLITEGILCHEGYGASCLMIDKKEQFVGVWSAVFYNGVWYPEALRNVASVMWSGIV